MGSAGLWWKPCGCLVFRFEASRFGWFAHLGLVGFVRSLLVASVKLGASTCIEEARGSFDGPLNAQTAELRMWPVSSILQTAAETLAHSHA